MKELLRKITPRNIWAYPRRSKIPKWKGDQRIFCISFQKTGTTSFGDFFEHFGYPRAGHGLAKWNNWTQLKHEENTEAIFSSKDFNLYQVFEDDPWWFPQFYKEIYSRYPNSLFVLLERDSDAWLNSMKKHFGERYSGNPTIHYKIYNRTLSPQQKEKYDKQFNQTGLVKLDFEGYDDQYKKIYETHIKEVKEFFADKPSSLLVVSLKDPKKWNKISTFVGFKIPENFEMHSNKASKK